MVTRAGTLTRARTVMGLFAGFAGFMGAEPRGFGALPLPAFRCFVDGASRAARRPSAAEAVL